MRQAQEILDRNQKIFLDGIKKYLERGIPIYVDGMKADDNLLRKIVERSDEGFYKSEYIMEEDPLEMCEDFCYGSQTVLREKIADYYAGDQRPRFHLKEIHFCKICYSSM